MDNESDAEMVRAVLSGQTHAYGRLVTRHEQAVRAAALTVLCDWHLAEDAAQEAFLRAYQGLGTLKNDSSFGFWVIRIARNLALDAARKRRPIESLEAQTPVAATAKAGPDLDEEMARVLAAVKQLPEPEWLVVVLRYLGGRSIEDVANVTGQPEGTVTSLLYRARERLRSQLKETSYEC